MNIVEKVMQLILVSILLFGLIAFSSAELDFHVNSSLGPQYEFDSSKNGWVLIPRTNHISTIRLQYANVPLLYQVWFERQEIRIFFQHLTIYFEHHIGFRESNVNQTTTWNLSKRSSVSNFNVLTTYQTEQIKIEIEKKEYNL